MKKQLNFMFFILFIVILAWLLSPSKSTREKLWVLKGISLAQPYKAAVAEYVSRKQTFPEGNDLEEEKIRVKVSFDRTAVESILVGEDGPGVISIHYSASRANAAPQEIDNAVIYLTPFLSEDRIRWTCTAAEMPKELTPAVCR